MGTVEAHSLKFFCEKIVNDPDLLAQDANGKPVGDKDFNPPIAVTHCNQFVQRVFRQLGYDSFDGMTANQIADHCRANWFACTDSEAREAAAIGDLVMAAWSNLDGHGHVAIPSADKTQLFSGKWNRYTIKVYSVGKENGLMGANYAFSESPTFYKLGRTTS